MTGAGAADPLRCGVCGEPNPPGFRFCGACGAPMQAPQPELEERKVVTTLFADLEASTELAARLDPEDLRAVLRPFFEAMAEEIERYGGTVQKYIGDAVVAVFGVPVAHEDDPERAVRAALAMQRRLEALNEDAGAGGERLAMRIGVNTGEVITATGVDRDALVTGEAVNIAARFEGLAPPGGVVVGDRTYRDTQHAVRYRSLGEVTVKGIDRALRAWEAEGETAPPAGRAAAPGLAPMVGREDELDLLGLLLNRTAREGRPSLVTVVGPAGIGKSRLCREFLDRAEERRPLRLVRGRCLPYGQGLTYWPLAEILKADAGIMDSDPAEAIREKARALVEERLPDEGDTGLAQVLLSSIGVVVEPDPLAGAEPAAARELIGRSWRRYLESLAADGPVVALIDDLHWADEGLLDLVEALADRGSAPLLLLCTARPDLVERRPSWGGGLGSAATISLSPLSAIEGERLVRHLLEGAPAPEEAVRAVLDRAEGNPFFAQELLRMVIETGSLVRGDAGWTLARPLPETLPDTVQGVLASRIDLLPAAEKRALQDAAVVGRTFWQGAVERLGGSPAEAALDALVDKGLVWERDGSVIAGEREFAFNHVLTTDVTYAGIPRARRAQAHAQALAWMEELTTGRSEEFAEILAHHADGAGDRARTARYAMLAGHRNRRVFAALEAIGWYDRAIQAAADAGGPDTASLVPEAALARGEAQEQLGSFDRAEADYRQALEGARASDQGLLEARALAALAHVHWLQDRFEAGREVLDLALERARAIGATQLLAQLLYTAGTLAFGQGRYEEALARHREALRVAESNQDRAGEALARHGLCETLYFLGPLDRSLAEGQRADELFRALAQRPMVHHNLYMVAWDLWLKGRLEESDARFDESVAGSREVGNRRDEGFALAGSQVKAHLGDVGAALRCGQAALDISREIQTPRLALAAGSLHFLNLMEVGAFGRAEAELAGYRQIADAIGTNFGRPRLVTLSGWVAQRAGDPSAHEIFAQARAATEGVLLEDMWVGWYEVYAAEDGGDATFAREAGTRLETRARDESPWLVPWGLYGQALGDSLEGRWETAAALAGEVIARVGQTGDRSLEWRAAAVASRALAALGRHAEAEAERSRAAAIVGEVAASLDDEDLRSSFLARPVVAGILAEGSATRLLAGTPPDELAELWARAIPRRFEPGEAVFRRGDPGATVYVVQEGHVAVTVPGERDGELVARLGPGDVFGEMAILDEGPRRADATAEGGSSVLEIAREDFLRFLQSRPRVAERLVALLGRRLEEDAATPGGPSLDEAAERLTEAMQRLAGREGAPGPAIEILPVYIRDGSIRWLRPAGSESLQVEAGSGGHPGDTVVGALARYGIRPEAVHSTSWRTGQGRLVVTYLAVLDSIDVPPATLRSVEVRRSELARGSATGPPPSIEIDHVIEHALRHFAWLLQDDPVIRDLFAERWGPALESYTPEPFRSVQDLSASGAE